MPILARIVLRFIPDAIRFCPRRYTSPLSGGLSILMQRSSVLLPEPLGPNIILTSRSATSSETPLINPEQFQGKDLMVFPCLVSHSKFSQRGIGKQLIEAAEKETFNQNRKGIATIGYFWDFWFMPAKYFLNLGFKVMVRRGEETIL